MLLGLFENASGCVSDSLKLVYFGRIRHGCGIKSEESAQLRQKLSFLLFDVPSGDLHGRLDNFGIPINSILRVSALEYVGLAPKGSQRVRAFLEKAAEGLVGGAKKGIFTPMYFFLVRKPISDSQ